MKKKILIFLIVVPFLLILFTVFLVSPVKAFSGEGEGTEADPYIITDVDELQEMDGDKSAYYVLGNGFDASVTTTWPGGFDPIGGGATPFTGTFDGQGFEITELYINRPAESRVGLFGGTGVSTEIKNVGLGNVTIIGRNDVGGLVGDNEGNIINSYSMGNLEGICNIGGLVGRNKGDITDSYSTGNVRGEGPLGGLVGFSSGNISDSYFTGSVTGTSGVYPFSSYTGGLVGENNGGNIYNSYAVADVASSFFYSPDGDYVGGLVGQNVNGGIISKSYSAGSVIGDNLVGGLVGYNVGGGIINNSYSTANTTGRENVGGLVGLISSSGVIDKSYSAGSVVKIGGFGPYVGGLVGHWEGGTCTDSFWDVQTSGQFRSGCGTGKTTAEMKNVATFTDISTVGLDTPWDFVNIWGIDSEINDGYPFFGAGSVVTPCQDHNVWGWAWSENIGWISFSCGEGVDYGVDIDEVTGLFSGYAWSENIGWISFNSADLAGCPSGTCEARLDLITGEISGWAKALAGADGWDGWIRLRDSDYGVWLDSSTYPPYSEFREWAWGSDVVGWISFNDKDFDGSSGQVDYQVMTDISINPAPSATILFDDDIGYCLPITLPLSADGEGGSRSSPPIRLNWTFDDPGDTQSAYQIQIDDSGSGFPSPEIDTCIPAPGTCSPGHSSETYAPISLNFDTTYWWRLKVWDSGDRPSGWINAPTTFITDLRWPNTEFTPDPTNPPAGVEVTFTDKSTCYGDFSNCRDDSNTSYGWDFEYDGSIMDTDTTNKGTTTHIYESSGDYTVRLEVTDGSRMCPFECPLGTSLPLPKWKEIPPF